VAGTSAVHKLSVNNGSGGAPELDIPGVKSQSSAGGIVDVQSGTAAGDIPVGSLSNAVLAAVAGNFRSINVFIYPLLRNLKSTKRSLNENRAFSSTQRKGTSLLVENQFQK